ncbi:MAG: MATE family efflux transporter [Deltaproteobacteria bacterium]|jgi:MATE family multidrug resistance protein|nr:MATE family efflux transporter [Deltaproteobacteria bacterium]
MSPHESTGRLGGLLSSIRLRNRWGTPQGYRELLSLALPLVFSNIAMTIMMFTDRIFLSRHSIIAIAAALPSGVVLFLIQSVFMGLVTYSGIFAAQYVGAGRPRRAATALWQGLWLSLALGFAMWALFFVSEGFFRSVGHSPELVAAETVYFDTLLICVPLGLCMATMSSFLSSLGMTRIVMLVNFVGTGLNIPLDYLLIFGFDLGFVKVEAMGIFGAAVATDISWCASTLLFVWCCFNNRMEKAYGTRSMWRGDWALMRRLVKYGYPSGVQLFLEVFAFTFFAFAVAKLDELTLAANNMVFSLENISFFPILGVGQAVSIMVGQAVGRGAPRDGEKAAVTGIVVSSVYVLVLLVFFFFFPRFLLGMFIPDGLDPSSAETILAMGTMMLRFVVLYSFFDGFYVCCFSVLRGAGDVIFPMLAMGFWGVVGLILPIIILFAFDAATIYTMWYAMVFWVVTLTLTVVWRYRTKIWMTKRVIERVEDLV